MTLGISAIMLAASLWAVDALIRTPLTQILSITTIVFWEHVVGLFILSPFVWRVLKRVPKIPLNHWLWFSLLSLVSSVGGTLLFTQALNSSFQDGDFITPLLLQKLQPIIVIFLSSFLIKEKISQKFLIFAPVALIGGYLMSFGLQVPSFALLNNKLVVVFSLGAAFCWAVGTIISKTVLKHYSVGDSLWLRFILALPIIYILSRLISVPISYSLDALSWIRFLAITLFTGAGALAIYYYGLKRTQAHKATIAELVFPLTSIIIGITPLNPYGQSQTLSLIQVIGILLLLFGIINSTQKS